MNAPVQCVLAESEVEAQTQSVIPSGVDVFPIALDVIPSAGPLGRSRGIYSNRFLRFVRCAHSGRNDGVVPVRAAHRFRLRQGYGGQAARNDGWGVFIALPSVEMTSRLFCRTY